MNEQTVQIVFNQEIFQNVMLGGIALLLVVIAFLLVGIKEKLDK